MVELDITIFRAINSLAGQSKFWDGFWIFATNYLPYVLAIMAFIALLVWKSGLKEKVKAAGIFLAAGGISYLSVLAFFNNIWPRLRPFDALQGVIELVPESGFSFPSKHALLAFLLATYVYGYNKRLGVALYVLASFVAISRVVVGVHYPSDVLGGIVIGILVGWAAVVAMRKISLQKLGFDAPQV